jgi:hypothetical protein
MTLVTANLCSFVQNSRRRVPSSFGCGLSVLVLSSFDFSFIVYHLVLIRWLPQFLTMKGWYPVDDQSDMMLIIMKDCRVGIERHTEGWRQICPSTPFLIKSKAVSSHLCVWLFHLAWVHSHTLILQLFSVWANVDWLSRCYGFIEATPSVVSLWT